jgi:hypothetical protein
MTTLLVRPADAVIVVPPQAFETAELRPRGRELPEFTSWQRCPHFADRCRASNTQITPTSHQVFTPFDLLSRCAAASGDPILRPIAAATRQFTHV